MAKADDPAGTLGGPRVDATAAPSERDVQSLVPLLRNLASDIRLLFRSELALAGLEVRTAGIRIAKESALLALGGIFVLLGFLVLLEFAVLALGRILGNYWLSSLIVGLVLVLIGVAVVVLGRRAIVGGSLKPVRTVRSVQETRDWAVDRVGEIKRDIAN